MCVVLPVALKRDHVSLLPAELVGLERERERDRGVWGHRRRRDQYQYFNLPGLRALLLTASTSY